MIQLLSLVILAMVARSKLSTYNANNWSETNLTDFHAISIEKEFYDNLRYSDRDSLKIENEGR